MFETYRSRSRDIQDIITRGMWGTVEHLPGAGSMMSIRRTGTTDEEVPIINFGYGFNLPPNSNAEVIATSLGSDVNDKVAFLTLPRDKQHPWAENTGGVQDPNDPERRIEFNGSDIWLKDGKFVLGHDRAVTVTVSGSNITISTGGNMVLEAGSVDIQSSTLTHNGKNIGDDHRHSDVQSGLDDTGEPI